MKKIIYLLLLVGLFACNNNGFKEHESGLQYRFIEENPTAQRPKIGDGLVIYLKYTTENDSVLYNGSFRLKLTEPSHKGGSIEDAFGLMHKGDSAEFLIDAKSFIRNTVQADKFPEFIEKSSKLKFYVRLNDILSPEQMEKMQEQLDAQGKAAETMLLDDYIEKNEIKQTPTESGMFIIPMKPGNGKAASSKDSLIVHYTGMFLDGTIFDSSEKRNEPFGFVLGANQVIKGWEEGCTGLKKGEKVRFIIPSGLAYGKKGVPDLIEPFTTLVFDVELLEIRSESN